MIEFVNAKKHYIMALAIMFVVVSLSGPTYSLFFNAESTNTFNYNTGILDLQFIEDEQIKNDIYDLNEYWTKKMDTIVVSISRKDLQPVSDYLQYLYAATINNNQEEAITYSRLLHYNLIGLKGAVPGPKKGIVVVEGKE